MKTDKQLRISDLQKIRGAVEGEPRQEEYHSKREDGDTRIAAPVRSVVSTGK